LGTSEISQNRRTSELARTMELILSKAILQMWKRPREWPEYPQLISNADEMTISDF
jgi:hypothetical protein